MKNPAVLSNKWLYQKGINYGFANTKAFVLDRDNHTCQPCKGKSKDSKLEVHHIIFRRNGGSDEFLSEANVLVEVKVNDDNGETWHTRKISMVSGIEELGLLVGNIFQFNNYQHHFYSTSLGNKGAYDYQRIVWYVSIILLSFGSAEESIMRVDSPNITNELLMSMDK